VLARSAPPDYSSKAEAALVRSGRAGLHLVFRTHALSIYYVPGAQPIAPGLVSLTESHIRLVVRHPGTIRIAVRYSPYWHASTGCLFAGHDGMLRLRTNARRTVSIVFAVDASRALRAFAGEQPSCASH
jgi:hypothetical protein